MGYYYILFLLLPFVSLGQVDSSFHFMAGLRMNNIGFAPVPAFSFNSPIITANSSATFNKVGVLSDIAVGLNGKPWLANLHFQYKFLERQKLKLTIGANPFLYFYEASVGDSSTRIIAQRNLNFEFLSNYQFNRNIGVHVNFMKIRGIDAGSLSGNFAILGLRLSKLKFINGLSINLSPEIFYFNFDGFTDGLFANEVLTISHQRFPVAFHFQAVQKMWANFSVQPFNSNIGLSIGLNKSVKNQNK